MIELLSSPEEDPKRHELFSIDGTVYTIPAKPRAWVSMKYMWALRNGTEANLAHTDLMVDLLGEENYLVLMGCKALTREQFDAISTEASKVAMGTLETEPMPEPGN